MTSIPVARDPELELLIPARATSPTRSSRIVIPALNEELTIGDFIDWCKEGLKKAGVGGEILIIDSSTDKTREIALSKGARVLQAPKRGLGRAYIDSLPFIRGKYVILGDCDCTYDFRELEPFVKKFHEGAEFIMGSRFRGYIEPGAMPPLHRYLGTPVTTWILNVIFSSHFSDIHCGMRGITKAAFERMGLRSQSWEYASEMVLKSVHMRLRTDEVPDSLPEGPRGAAQPPQALRVVFAVGGGVDQPARDVRLRRGLLPLPAGLVLAALGLALTLPLSLGPVDARADHAVAPLDAPRAHARDPRSAVRLHGHPRAGLLRLLGGDHEALVHALPVHADGRRAAGCSSWGSGFMGALSSTT